MPQHLLLTRPETASRRFADQCRARFGADLSVTIAPVMGPVAVAPDLAPTDFATFVFTSPTAPAFAPPLRPGRQAWCVGDRTAQAAADLGLAARSVGGDVEALLAALLEARPETPLLHLRGRDSTGNLAARLTAAGLPTAEAVVYAQEPLDLTPEAQTLLAGEVPVFAPVFSPRSARLLSAQTSGRTAPLFVAAISGAVVRAWVGVKPDEAVVAARPDAVAMLDALAALGLGAADGKGCGRPAGSA